MQCASSAANGPNHLGLCARQELPADREWERAERALSITSANIDKRFYNCWGRCSPKRCTATRQVSRHGLQLQPLRTTPAAAVS